MAGSSFTSASAQAHTYRRAGLILEAEQRCNFLLLCGSDPDSIVHVEPSTGTKRGTTEIITFQPHNRSPMPKGRLSQIWGQEGSATYLNDSLVMTYLVLADGAVENEVSDQNEILFSQRDSEHTRMAHDAAIVMECSGLHQLAGYSVVNDLTSGGPNGTGYKDGTSNYILSFGNPCVEPDTQHHFFADDNSGTNANEAAVAADPTSFLSDKLVRRAIRKMVSDSLGNKYPWALPQTPWGKGYVCLTTGEGMDQVKARISENEIWDLARACIEGGMDPENSMLWSYDGFKFRDVFYLQNDHLPLGTTGSSAGSTTAGEPLPNCQRSLLLGPRAAHIRWGEGFSRDKWAGFKKEEFMRRYSCMTDTVVGMNVTIPNSGSRTETGAQRWGSCVLSHYTEITTARYS
jgi:hypothetical protein